MVEILDALAGSIAELGTRGPLFPLGMPPFDVSGEADQTPVSGEMLLPKTLAGYG